MPDVTIDELLIANVVDTFYARVQRDPELAPIFERAIGGNWDDHLPTMKRFWAAVMLRTGGYSGRPVPVHRALPDVAPRHFRAWLRLFETTVADVAGDPQVTEQFMEKANRIATSLQLAMWGESGRPSAALRVAR